MKTLKIFLLFIVIIFSTNSLSSGDNHNFRVLLVVSADESIKGKIESYISRELRSLGDIIQVNEDYKYVMSITGLETHNKKGDKIGVALSVIILPRFDSQFLSSLFENAKHKKIIIGWTGSLYWEPIHWLLVGPSEDLQSICKNIVTYFDNEVLQKSRDEDQRFEDKTRKMRKALSEKYPEIKKMGASEDEIPDKAWEYIITKQGNELSELQKQHESYKEKVSWPLTVDQFIKDLREKGVEVTD